MVAQVLQYLENKDMCTYQLKPRSVDTTYVERTWENLNS